MSDTYEVDVKIHADSSEAESAYGRVGDGLSEWGINLDKLYEKGSEVFKKFGIDVDQFASKLGTTGPQLTALAAGAAIAVEGIKKLGEFIADCTKDFADVETAQLKFNAAMSASATITDKGAKSLSELAEKTGLLTGNTTSSVQSQIAMLAATGRTEDQIKSMITAAEGLSNATGVDLNTALTQINATFSGTSGRLSKMTPELKDLTKEQLENGGAVDVLNKKYGEFSGTLSGSTAVSIANQKNQIGELKSILGEFFESGLKPIRDMITSIIEYLVNNKQIVIGVIEGVGVALSVLVGLFNPVLGAIGLVVTAYFALSNAVRESKASFETATDAMAKNASAAIDIVGPITGVGNGHKLTSDQIERLVKLYPDLSGKMSDNNTTQREALALIDAINKADLQGMILKEQQAQILLINARDKNIESLKTEFHITQDQANMLKSLYVEMARQIDLSAKGATTKKELTTAENNYTDALKSMGIEQGSLSEKLNRVVGLIKNENDQLFESNGRMTDAEKAIKGLSSSSLIAAQNQALIGANAKLSAEDQKKSAEEGLAWDKKIADDYVKNLDTKEAAEISMAEKKKATLEEVLAISKKYDDDELVYYTKQMEAQEAKDLEDATKKKATPETIATIKQYYADQITQYENTQIDKRAKLETDYGKTLSDEAAKNLETQLKNDGSILLDHIKTLDSQESVDIANAQKRNATLAEVVSIAKKYDDEELGYFTDKTNDQRKAELIAAEASKKTPEEIASINAKYDSQITQYKQTQIDKSSKLESDYTLKLGDETIKRTDYENSWSKKVSELSGASLQTKLDAIQKEENSEVDKANALGANEEAIANIHKYYEDEKTKVTQSANSKMIASAVATLSSIASHVTSSIKSIASGIASVFSSIVNFNFDDFVDTIDKDITAIQTFFTSTLAKFPDLLNKLVDELPTVIKSITDYLSDNAGTIITSFMNAIVNAFSNIATILPDILKAINKLIAAVLKGIDDNIDSITDSIISIIDTIIDSMTANLPQFTEDITNIIMKLVKAIAAKLPDIFSKIGDLISSLIATIPDLLPEMIDAGIALFKGLIEGLAQALPKIISAIADALPSIIEEIVSGIVLLISAIIEELPTIIDAIIKCIPSIVKAVVKAIPAIIKGLVENAPALVQALIDLIVDVFTEIIPDIVSTSWDTGKELLNSIGDGITETAPALWDSICGVFDTIFANLKNFFSQAVSIGENIINGIVTGIENAVDSAVDAVESACSSVWSAVKSFFGINSPSTLLASAGDNLMLGMAQGISRSASSAIKTMTDANKAISDAANVSGQANTTGYATGTSYSPAGYYTVGELGAEQVYLPQGSSVSNASETASSKSSSKSSGNTYGDIIINSPTANANDAARLMKRTQQQLAFASNT